jgi:hypothetical protein
MDIKIDKTQLKGHKAPTDELLNRIASGKAILFTGAGFSLGSKNIYQTPPPNATTLARSICRLGEFEEDDDLKLVKLGVRSCIDALRLSFYVIARPALMH